METEKTRKNKYEFWKTCFKINPSLELNLCIGDKIYKIEKKKTRTIVFDRGLFRLQTKKNATKGSGYLIGLGSLGSIVGQLLQDAAAILQYPDGKILWSKNPRRFLEETQIFSGNLPLFGVFFFLAKMLDIMSLV